MKLEVGDLVRRRRGKRKQEVGFVIKILNNIDTATVSAGHFVRVQWTDGLKWNHLPDSLIKV